MTVTNTEKQQSNNTTTNNLVMSGSDIMNMDSLWLKSYYFSAPVTSIAVCDTFQNLKVIKINLTWYYSNWSQYYKAFTSEFLYMSTYKCTIDFVLTRFWIFLCTDTEFQWYQQILNKGFPLKSWTFTIRVVVTSRRALSKIIYQFVMFLYDGLPSL